MLFTLADTLETLVPELPEALVSTGAKERFLQTAQYLSAHLAGGIYLESRLGPEERVDLSFDTSRIGYKQLGSRQGLLPENEGGTYPNSWKPIHQLYHRFSDKASLLGQLGEKILLEFDIAESGSTLPVPGVFVGIRPQGYVPRQKLLRFVTDDVLDVLYGPLVTARVRSRLLTCLQAMPKEAHLAYVGCMIARSEPAVRLCITQIAPSQIYAYLCRVGGQGIDETRALCKKLERVPPAMLHLDVWEQRHPRIGLEFLFNRSSQRKGNFKEKAWLDALVEHNLCMPEKRDALLEWPGVKRKQFRHVFWPTVVSKRVNHVKVSWSPNQVEAKAYLYSCVHSMG